MDTCTNCGSRISKFLNKSTIHSKRVVMSDGSFALNFNATQSYCSSCKCISIAYDPPNRLENYFSDEYDVTDKVQNCQVVFSGKNLGKHSIIHESLLNYCSKLPEKGTFIEIASGNGILSKKFAQQHKYWHCTAIDPSIHSAKQNYENICFINGFFDPKLFEGSKFDVIVAHGILNRTPPFKMLNGITSILNQNGIVSIEVVILEGSIYAPFIWDHCYTYLEKTFECYLNHFGLMVDKKIDCGTTVQFICKYDKKKKLKTFKLDHSLNELTLSEYNNHNKLWDEIIRNFTSICNENKDKKIALFGAGLYTGVLMNQIDERKVDFIIDEIRYGKNFDNKNVVNLTEAKQITDDFIVLLCCSPKNIGYLETKLTKANINVLRLH
jgi:hypothetical protein